MKKAERLAESWVRDNGIKGEYQMSLDVIQEVAFEAGRESAIEELRSEAAGFTGIISRFSWADWLDREEPEEK